MPDLDFTVRKALEDTSAEIPLPAMYDALSFEQRRLVRGQYAREQGGLCYHCKAPLAGEPSPEALAKPINKDRYPPNFFAWKHHLHHNHRTGLTLGTVHAHCNAVLWEHHGE